MPQKFPFWSTVTFMNNREFLGIGVLSTVHLVLPSSQATFLYRNKKVRECCCSCPLWPHPSHLWEAPKVGCPHGSLGLHTDAVKAYGKVAPNGYPKEEEEGDTNQQWKPLHWRREGFELSNKWRSATSSQWGWICRKDLSCLLKGSQYLSPMTSIPTEKGNKLS